MNTTIEKEYYPHRLERQIREIKEKYPQAESFLNKLIANQSQSSTNYDYEAEKIFASYKLIESEFDKLLLEMKDHLKFKEEIIEDISKGINAQSKLLEEKDEIISTLEQKINDKQK